MKFGIPAATRSGGTGFAAAPETIKKLAASARYSVIVQSGPGAMMPVALQRGRVDIIGCHHPAGIKKESSCLRS
jgi:hypothetical protein